LAFPLLSTLILLLYLFLANLLAQSAGCLDNKQPSFNAWAFNTLSSHEASVRQYNDPKQAATDALTALFVASPADKTQCFPPPTEWADDAHAASMMSAAVDIPALL
jgi:hypothetical protein